MKNKKVTISIIIILSLAIVAAGIFCAVIFWPQKPLTLQEQLNQFKASLKMINATEADANGNPSARNIIRNITITENGKIVAEYTQTFIIYIDGDGKLTAYLSVEEKYPTLNTKEFNIFDEYYLSNNVMYTRRVNDKDFTSSHFSSGIDTLFVVVFENIGNIVYDFTEDNFKPLTESATIISGDKNTRKLSALINEDKCGQFFGESVDVSELSDVKLEMNMTNLKFDSLLLSYAENGRNVVIRIISSEPVPIMAPE